MGPDGDSGTLYFLRGGKYVPAFRAIGTFKAKTKIAYRHTLTFTREEKVVKPHWWSRKKVRFGPWELSDAVVNEEITLAADAWTNGLLYSYCDSDNSNWMDGYSLDGIRRRPRKTRSIVWKGCRINDVQALIQETTDWINAGTI